MACNGYHTRIRQQNERAAGLGYIREVHGGYVRAVEGDVTDFQRVRVYVSKTNEQQAVDTYKK
jgi:hypothetical protein